ncbi:MAG: DsrE/DsrF/DrsH-like family protein [Deltaproteobacteria bacterium]|nr:DsrE/DsrF/DrsH-like family protein [Deltaproteobacteria bacterium]
MTDKTTIVVHSGDMDKLYSALIISTGALAMGMEASLYFTFWGLERLFQDFKELGGKIIACDMTMEIMGIKKEDLRQDLIDEYGAVGTYIEEARNSKITLFI